jgi:hypothetical protein
VEGRRNKKYIKHVKTLQKLIVMVAHRDKRLNRHEEIKENILEKTWEIKRQKEK